MTTLNQVRKQNERLRKANEKIQNIQKLQREKEALIRENKQLAFITKYPKSVALSKSAANTTARFGKTALRGLKVWGQRLAEAERREQMRNRQLKRMVKKTKTKLKRR